MIELEKVYNLLAVRRGDVEVAANELNDFVRNTSHVAPEFFDNASKKYTELKHNVDLAKAKVETLKRVIDLAVTDK